MQMAFSIGFEYLMSRKKQTILSMLGVILGVGFFIAVSSMMQGMHRYFIEKLVDASPNIKIMDEYREAKEQPIFSMYPDYEVELLGVKPKEEIKGIRASGAIMSMLDKMPDLTYSPVMQGQVFVRYGGKDRAVNLIGINPDLERHASNLERDMKSGSLNSLLTNSNGIIVGRELARRLELRLGSNVNVVSPVGIVKHMKVVGIFDTGVPEMDLSAAYAMLKQVQILQRKENRINQINIKIKDVNKALEIAANIERQFRYRTEGWQETYSNIFQLFVIQNIILYSTVGAIMLVAGFGIFNIISTSVNHKVRDIAILKSMGFSQKDISLIFVLQGLLIGIIGTIIGWILGTVLVELLAILPFDLGENVQTPVRFDGLPMYRSVSLYIISAAIGLLASVLSAYFPANNAASLHPVDIIRGVA